MDSVALHQVCMYFCIIENKGEKGIKTSKYFFTFTTLKGINYKNKQMLIVDLLLTVQLIFLTKEIKKRITCIYNHSSCLHYKCYFNNLIEN